MELNEPEPVQPTTTPAKVVVALVAMWILAAFVLLLTVTTWRNASAQLTLGDFLYYYPAQALLLPLFSALTVVAAIGFHQRKN